MSDAGGEAALRPRPFQLRRLGVVMEPAPGDEREVEGVLNPAAARGSDRELYLFPRLVARGNHSRIGLARVRFGADGDPVGVERLGVALEPTAAYEALGCEDPRVTFVEPLGVYVMTYTAFSPRGACIALATSRDLLAWERLGPVRFVCHQGVDFGDVPNKDAFFFPEAIPDMDGRQAVALVHRPLFPGTEPEMVVGEPTPRAVDMPHESIWLSYVPLESCMADVRELGHFRAHHRLLSPVAPWERVKVGGGTPPIRTDDGWLMLYHGVSGDPGGDGRPRRLQYSAGALVLDQHDPRIIRYRSPEPVLAPELPEEMLGIVANVVFPTAVDCRHDLGRPELVDVYYGMADNRIGAARLELPDRLPPDALADPPGGRV
ncbi:MAG: glycosidase [Chloroflexi bacterium]|nr:glycosidase [Chloroflexota bacterium]